MQMSTSSCPGFLDRDSIWNNGFDCSSPRICCGTETNRYCCVPSPILTSSSPSSSPPLLNEDFDDSDPYIVRASNTLLNDKWLLLQICTVGIFLAILLLLIAIIYLYLTTMRHGKVKKKRSSIVQLPLPAVASIYKEPARKSSNRTSTISSSGSSDTKSACTETSVVFNTPLNRYPASHSRSSTSSSSSYYLYPNEFEFLCK